MENKHPADQAKFTKVLLFFARRAEDSSRYIASGQKQDTGNGRKVRISSEWDVAGPLNMRVVAKDFTASRNPHQ